MAAPSRNLIFCLILFVGMTLHPLLARASEVDGGLLSETQCLSSPYDTPQGEAQIHVHRLVEIVQEYFTAFPTIAEAFRARKPLICIDNRPTNARGYLETDSNLIALSHRLSFDEMLAIFLHELRHLEQLSHGHCPSSTVSMQENARAIMATEADAAAIASLIAYRMREDGLPGPWQAMMTWPNYRDIPQRFEEIMAKTDDTLTATAAAFTQWYLSDWRTEAYYLSSCSDYLDQLDRTKALPRYDLLPDDFLDRLCHLPTGEAYECEPR